MTAVESPAVRAQRAVWRVTKRRRRAHGVGKPGRPRIDRGPAQCAACPFTTRERCGGWKASR